MTTSDNQVEGESLSQAEGARLKGRVTCDCVWSHVEGDGVGVKQDTSREAGWNATVFGARWKAIVLELGGIPVLKPGEKWL